jgi:NAD(P)H-flavin reductase
MTSPCLDPADPLRATPCRIAGVVKETHDTFTLALEAPPNGPRAFAPGQFNMLYVFAAGELPISLSGDPESRGRLVHTVRSVGPATLALVTSQPGASVGVRGPFGAGWPLAQARGKDILLAAGGIGLAPLRPAVYHILRHRGDYGRLVILYGARSPKDLLFRKELQAWSFLPDTQVLTTVDYGGVSWRGHVGVVTTLFKSVRLQPRQTAAFICGPEVMMRFVVRELETRGVPPAQIALSLERNMKCATGFCGHCQMGPLFVCKDGPVFPWSRLRPWMDRYEL